MPENDDPKVPKWVHFDDYLESSDLGRNPRFAAGWWILPGLIAGVVCIVVAMVIA